MNIFDIIILITLLLFAFIGFKRGILKELISVIGFILVIYLAYLLKNYLGDVFVTDLPFFAFKIGPVTSEVINIVMYQTIAFVIIVLLLGLIYKAVVIMSGIIEKILTLTIVLGIPSKILGLIAGLLEGYIIVYLVLFVVSQPYVKINVLNESNYAKTILNNTPVLSSFANNTLEVIDEVNNIVNSGDTNDFELRLSELILKNKVTSPEVMKELVDNKKINVNGIDEIISQYKDRSEEESDD